MYTGRWKLALKVIKIYQLDLNTNPEVFQYLFDLIFRFHLQYILSFPEIRTAYRAVTVTLKGVGPMERPPTGSVESSEASEAASKRKRSSRLTKKSPSTLRAIASPRHFRFPGKKKEEEKAKFY